MRTTTRTFALLEVSPATFAEIRAKFEEAGYGHAFTDLGDRVAIDMHGVALVMKVTDAEPVTLSPETA